MDWMLTVILSLEEGIAKTHLGRDTGPNGRGVYLEKAHDQLIKKVVGDSPSWRAFANVINCTNLVLSVAYKLEKQNQLESHRIKEVKYVDPSQLRGQIKTSLSMSYK